MRVARAALAAGGVAALVGLFALAGCGGDELASTATPSYPKKLVVIGVDGMDPNILRTLMDAGQMPNLKELADSGTFVPLATTNPPQSPVAWSTFITGLDPAQTGIFDFVHRDPDTLEPYLSTSKTIPPRTLDLGLFEITTSSGDVELLRKGRPFWSYLDEQGVPATVVKIPANYPAKDSGPSHVMGEMGVPDIMGTPGTFQVFTTDPAWAGKTVQAGIIHRLEPAGEQHFRTALSGPPGDGGKALTLPVEVVVSEDQPLVMITVGDQRVMLTEGEWSRWLPTEFDGGFHIGTVSGMVRLYLKSVRPHLFVYASPINIDPSDPIEPIASPPGYAPALATEIGRFYTQGMPPDTKAMAGDVLSDDEALAQGDIIFAERMALLRQSLKDYHGGLLFFYFSTVDQLSHVFYRTLPEGGPDPSAARGSRADIIPSLYRRVDAAIGEVRKSIGDDATLIVMSDHGFTRYRRKVHLNSWLEQRGYLSLAPPGQRTPGAAGQIDWSKTQAYAMGLNGLYLNLQGRERYGSVPPAQRQQLIKRLRRDLLSWRDPDTGERVVTSAQSPGGQFTDRAPDLLIGYQRGYRSSDESAVGQVDDVLIEDNHDKWSGDHCIDPRHVPGALLSNVRLSVDRGPGLRDLAPTILDFFGIQKGENMTGRSLLPK